MAPEIIKNSEQNNDQSVQVRFEETPEKRLFFEQRADGWRIRFAGIEPASAIKELVLGTMAVVFESSPGLRLQTGFTSIAGWTGDDIDKASQSVSKLTAEYGTYKPDFIVQLSAEELIGVETQVDTFNRQTRVLRFADHEVLRRTIMAIADAVAPATSPVKA